MLEHVKAFPLYFPVYFIRVFFKSLNLKTWPLDFLVPLFWNRYKRSTWKAKKVKSKKLYFFQFCRYEECFHIVVVIKRILIKQSHLCSWQPHPVIHTLMVLPSTSASPPPSYTFKQFRKRSQRSRTRHSELSTATGNKGNAVIHTH